MLWHSTLSFCLQRWHAIWPLVQVLVSPCLIQFLSDVPEKGIEDDPSAWTSVTHMGDLDEGPGQCDHLESEKWMEDLSLFFKYQSLKRRARQ